ADDSSVVAEIATHRHWGTALCLNDSANASGFCDADILTLQDSHQLSALKSSSPSPCHPQTHLHFRVFWAGPEVSKFTRSGQLIKPRVLDKL
ncbi:hypothetical protein GOODEAATRI_009981, partial [Goodea atripinnis]